MHVGKTIVATIINNVQFVATSNRPINMPRKRWLKVMPSTLPGTIGARWADREILSGVAYRWEDDERQTAWRYDNPDYLDNYAIQRFQLIPGPDYGLDPWMFYMQHLTFWDGSTKIAEDSQPTDADFALANRAIWALPIGPTWAYRISIPEWNTMSTRSKSATWDDQPEYRPYDPRP